MLSFYIKIMLQSALIRAKSFRLPRTYIAFPVRKCQVLNAQISINLNYNRRLKPIRVCSDPVLVQRTIRTEYKSSLK